MTVSETLGLMCYQYSTESTDAVIFNGFFQGLATEVPEVAVLMDSASWHTCGDTLLEMSRLVLYPLFNVPCQLDLNGIERVFTILQSIYKRTRLD